MYKSLLMRNASLIEGRAQADRYRKLMNLLMQLRKCCNHPYMVGLRALGLHPC